MCECYKIGGPFIAEDPDCPEHGTEARQREERSDDRIAELERENARLRDALGALVHDIQSFAMCEHGSLDLAQHYAPSLSNAISALPKR